MIYKLKIKDLQSQEEYWSIMGDSYKSFEDHFQDVVSLFTKKWIYESPDKYSKCLGRTLTVEFLELWKSKERFVSFGGPKLALEEDYDSKVKEHNDSGSYRSCKYLKDIEFSRDDELLKELIKKNRIIMEDSSKD